MAYKTGKRRLANAVIIDPEPDTTMAPSGAVRSIQAADVELPKTELESLWSPMYLERLARTYWKYLSRVTLGTIRVEYRASERDVVLLRSPLVLLRFAAPEYALSKTGGIVTWRIRSGALVAKRGQDGDGYLRIEVRRLQPNKPDQARVQIKVEVANFYPALATPRTRFLYQNTQSRIHVLITHGFLRSLERLELEPSAVGLFADWEHPTRQQGSTVKDEVFHIEAPVQQRPVRVGETPWLFVSAAATAVALTWLSWRRTHRH